MKNWSLQDTPWNSNNVNAYSGESFREYRKRTFFVETDLDPTRQEVIAFISSKGFDVYDVRYLNTVVGEKTRHFFEAFVASPS